MARIGGKIYSGGKSTAVRSPRHLVIRHARRVVREKGRTNQHRSWRIVDEKGSGHPDEDQPPNPGEEKLNSYWAPGLQAGPAYAIKATQIIDSNTGKDEQLLLASEQAFYVEAPQFSLPDGSLHSVYPPMGYSDDARILPHVVLTDPHLPWERFGSSKPQTAVGRNKVPWLVLLSFSQEELRLQPVDLDGEDSIFRNTSPGLIKPVQQTSTMTVSMSVDDLWLTKDTETPVTREIVPPARKDSRGDFIFVEPDLFTSLFSTFDANGRRRDLKSPDTDQYKYLAHVRQINPSGMALAGVEDKAIFSVVVGNRAGPLDVATAVTTSVHLVSIEGVDSMEFPIRSRFVAMSSLYSWNYTVLPPGMLNVPAAFESLGRTLDVLRAPDRVISPLRSRGKVADRIAERLEDGYSLVNYRPQTGESTVALFRGPLTPTFVPQLENLNACSNTGIDLQIMDRDVGIMDITYSVAWQVGRTMALGDATFAAALGRIRSTIQGQAMQNSKIDTIREVSTISYRSRQDVLYDLPNLIDSLSAIHIQPSTIATEEGDDGHAPPSFRPGGAKKRWNRRKLTARELPGLTFTSPAIEERYPKRALSAARALALGSNGQVYDETNEPESTDWMTLLSWLLDRMFLAGIPAHYLVPDPSYLEPERLRFFHIDANWVDALIDGALSLGNHMGDDKDRVAIKKAFNEYIHTTPEHMDHSPQIPTYGFFLRSDLVTMFPDLRVQVLPTTFNPSRTGARSQEPADPGAPLLRHEIITDGVMLAFTDRIPGTPNFGRLVFTQPGHQRRFAVGSSLNSSQMKGDIQRQYTVTQSVRDTDSNRHVALAGLERTRATPDPLFLWDIQPGSRRNDLRIVLVQRYAELQLQTLLDLMPYYQVDGQDLPYFWDDTATSALLAMQLNDPVYDFTIDLEHIGRSRRLSPHTFDAARPWRTLKWLRLPDFRKLCSAPSCGRDDSDSKAAVDAGEGMSDGGGGGSHKHTFQRLESYHADPSALGCFGPHLRPIPHEFESTGKRSVHKRALARASSPSAEPLPSTAPKYDIVISSNVPGGTKLVRISPAGSPNLPQDLIFSIRVRNNTSDRFKLVELGLRIPLGPPPASQTKPGYLMVTYNGPGAHMLTNLRCNILAAFVTAGGVEYLQLRVLPRAARAWISATDLQELSFVLGLVPVNAAPWTATAEVSSWADYCVNVDPTYTVRYPNDKTSVAIVPWTDRQLGG